MSKIQYGQVFATPVGTVDGVLSNIGSVLNDVNAIYHDYCTTSHFVTNYQRDMPAVTYWDTLDIVSKYPQLQTIVDQLQPHVDEYARRIAARPVAVQRSTSWLCYQDRNSFHPKHNHWARTVDGNVSAHNINAIVYLQAEAGDQLELFWPTPLAALSQPDPLFSSDRAAKIDLISNRAIIIPSWVDHGCEARKRTTQKICMSINYQYIK